MVQLFVYILMNFVVLMAVINAYVSSANSKQIFCNFELVFNILRDNLKEIIDYRTFSRKFNLTIIKISAFYVCGLCATLTFVYQHNQSNIFLWSILAAFPYIFFTVILSYLIFFVKLITLNLNSMIKILEKLHKSHELSKLGHGINIIGSKHQQRNSGQLYESMLILKRIYGHLYETTSLVNEMLGSPLIFLIVTMIMGNISSGYKLYLSLMGDVFIGRVGGLNIIFIKLFKALFFA